MGAIKQNALQLFLARPDAEQVQAKIADMYAQGLTRRQIEEKTGFSYKFLYKLSVHQKLAAGTLAPNTKCGSCSKPLYVVPSKLVHDNFCNKACIANHLRFAEPIVRVCNCCSKEFTVRSHGIRNKSCSYECSVTFRTQSVYRDCETCGTEMGPLHPSSEKRFCTKICRGKSLEVRVRKTCMQCGVQKEICPSKAAWDIFTCSQGCLLMYRKTNDAYRLKRNANLSAAIKEKWAKETSWAMSARLRLSKRAAQQIKEWGHDAPSSAELLCMEVLKQLGIKFEAQHQVYSAMYNCVKSYDFWLPELNVLVEVHGTFWHADPRKYPDRKRWTHTQKHNRRNDSIKANIALVEARKRLLVVWEEDLVSNRDIVRNLFATLKQNVRGSSLPRTNAVNL